MGPGILRKEKKDVTILPRNVRPRSLLEHPYAYHCALVERHLRPTDSGQVPPANSTTSGSKQRRVSTKLQHHKREGNNASQRNLACRRLQQGLILNLANPPPRYLISRCLSSCFRGYGTLVCLFPEVCLMRLFQAAYSPTPANPEYHGTNNNAQNSISHAEFALLLLTAAVGAIYIQDFDSSVKAAGKEFFRVGMENLDLAFQTTATTTTDRIRTAEEKGGDEISINLKLCASAMAALYLIFGKNISARKHLERAIQLARSRGFHMNYTANNTGMPDGARQGITSDGTTDWQGDSWRRVWQSMIFLDGWLSASVGYSPVTDITAFQDDYDSERLSDIDQNWHVEMGKLGILMSAITQDVCAPKAVDIARVRDYNSRLRAWHDNLPGFLKLSKDLEFKSDPARRTSILLTHCAYLGSLILLTRRILIAQTNVLRNQVQDVVYNHVDQEMVELSQDCIYAARQLATVVGIFFMEGRLVRKCWLGIQSAFTSCLIIFLELATMRGHTNALPQAADVELVSRCIYALEYCAAADLVARSYLNSLIPVRNILFPGYYVSQGGASQFQYNYSHRSDSLPSASPAASRTLSASPSKRPRTLSSGVGGRDILLGVPTSSTVPLSTNLGPSLAFGHGTDGFAGNQPTDQASQFNSSDALSVDVLVSHILEHLEKPYGGDGAVVKGVPSNVPSTWRFLNPNPPKLPDPQPPPSLTLAQNPMPGHIPFTFQAPASQDGRHPNFPAHRNDTHDALPNATQRHEQHFRGPAGPALENGRPTPTFAPGRDQYHGAHHHHHYHAQQQHREFELSSSVASPGGPILNMPAIGVDGGGGGDHRRKMPFRSMQEYENFMRRVV